MGNPVVHFEIISQDAERLRKFYGEMFDWQFDAPMMGANVPDYTVVRPSPNGGIAGGIATCPEGYDGHLTFYVGVPNLAAALRKVESLGGKTMMGPDEVPDGPLIGLFEDPQGHVVGLVQVGN